MHGALPLHLAVVPRVASVLTEFPLGPRNPRVRSCIAMRRSLLAFQRSMPGMRHKY